MGSHQNCGRPIGQKDPVSIGLASSLRFLSCLGQLLHDQNDPACCATCLHVIGFKTQGMPCYMFCNVNMELIVFR
eukprot:3838119-Amphidinium_carterae.1